ncbi:MAG: hypothetical protein ACJA19_000221, partial [Bacteroidia bacterium]
MKSLIEQIIKLRNPVFRFDTAIDTRILIQFIGMQTAAMLRGLKVLLKGKNPKGILLG